MLSRSKAFSHQTLETVARDRASNRPLRHCKSEARMRKSVRSDENREVLVAQALGAAENALELGRPG
jgi:hypothetical protein